MNILDPNVFIARCSTIFASDLPETHRLSARAGTKFETWQLLILMAKLMFLRVMHVDSHQREFLSPHVVRVMLMSACSLLMFVIMLRSAR
jgi:hypothetical protein